MGKVKTAGALIFIVLLLLVFFSGTIYRYNMPEAEAALPKNGKLHKSETVSGVAQWSHTAEIYFNQSGKIEQLHVEEGDRVEEGQLMATLSFDADEAKLRLTQLEIDHDKLLVANETSNLCKTKLEQQMQNLRNEVYDADAVSDYTIVQLEAKIAKARENLSRKEEHYIRQVELYNAGAIARQELDDSKAARDDAAFELDTLLLDYDNAIWEKRDAEEQNAKTVADKEKNRRTQLDDWAHEIETIRQTISDNNLNIRKNAEEQESHRKQLQSYSDNVELRAPQSGEVVSMTVKQGETVDKNAVFATLGLGSSFDIVCSLSLKNNFVLAGDDCKISNNDHSFPASVAKLSPTGQAKEVTVRVTSVEITSGETFDVEFSKEAAKPAILVPNGAINKDSDGHFVYCIRKRKGILGDEYYADKARVYIGDSDDDNTVVTQGITFFEPLVLLADKPISGGDTIKVRNEGDFFVD